MFLLFIHFFICQSSLGLFANYDISFYIIIYYAYISQPIIIYGMTTKRLIRIYWIFFLTVFILILFFVFLCTFFYVGSITTILRKLMYKQVLCLREWIGKQIFFCYIMFKLWWIDKFYSRCTNKIIGSSFL